MAAHVHVENVLRSTNCEACKQLKERLDEFNQFRDELIRLNAELNVCKHFAEGLLEDIRKLTVSAEKTKDELGRELEGFQQVTKRHLEEMKQLSVSAEKDNDELRKELLDTKQAAKRYLEELEEIKVSSRKEQAKQQSEHKENIDPHKKKFGKRLKAIFGSTKSKKKKKKRKKSLSDESTEGQLEEPKARIEASMETDNELDHFKETTMRQLRELKLASAERIRSADAEEVETSLSPVQPKPSPQDEYASTVYGNYTDLDRHSRRVSQSSYGTYQNRTYFEDKRSLDRSYSSEASLLHLSFDRLNSSVMDRIMRGSKSNISYGRHFVDEYQDPGAQSFDLYYSGQYRPLVSSDPQQVPMIKIEEEPKSQKQKEGSRVQFEFKVQGENPLSYQWFKDGVELSRENNASLVLESIELRHYGSYKCQVCYQDGYGETISSRPAVLDVIPQCLNGMRPKRLQEVDLNARDEICFGLDNKRYGLGCWRQIAAKYDMQESKIAALENSREPGKDVMEFLSGSRPQLTVYSFFKLLMDNRIKRFDIAKLLEDHLLIRDNDCFV